MTSALVTGATTPLGGAIVRGLLAERDTRAVLAVGIEGRPPELPIDDPRLVYRSLDLTRSRNVRRLVHGQVRALAIDTVVHTAQHRSARAHGREVHRLNVDATRELLALAEDHPTIHTFVLRSDSAVYRLEHDRPNLIGEDHPLELAPGAPQWVRDRVEADLTVCTRMGMTSLRVVVLRFAEVLAARSGSQLWDYLTSHVCLRPVGFDPMLNLLTIEDARTAVGLAVRSEAAGVFNIPGADTLPLSLLVELWGRRGVALPGPLLSPLYALRRLTIGTQFRYDLNARRFHHNNVLDGARAHRVLGYEPDHPIHWPRAT